VFHWEETPLQALPAHHAAARLLHSNIGSDSLRYSVGTHHVVVSSWACSASFCSATRNALSSSTQVPATTPSPWPVRDGGRRNHFSRRGG
jgi:hypothetical protein